MKPIRKEELLHYNSVIDREFRKKADAVKSEINQTAQVVADKKKSAFPKAVKVDKKLSALNKAYKDYDNFVRNMDNIKKQKAAAVDKIACDIAEQLNRLGNVRSWNENFHWSIRDLSDGNPVHYFERQLNQVCFDECYKQAESQNKLRTMLESQKAYCQNILYSGGSINSVVGELHKAMKQVQINLPIPSNLLQIEAPKN